MAVLAVLVAVPALCVAIGWTMWKIVEDFE